MAKRTRRTTQTVQDEVLRAAQEVFGERGYAGTSTKEIANRAQVSEPLVFRHYQSKANLFDEAVLDPLAQFIADYTTRWNAETDHSGEAGDLARRYISGLYDLLSSHKDMVMAAVTAYAYEDHLDGGSGGTGAAFQALLGRLEDLVRQGWAEQRWRSVDPMLAVRLTFGLVMSAAVFDGWLFPASRRPSKRRLIDELTEYMLHGLTDRPGGS